MNDRDFENRIWPKLTGMWTGWKPTAYEHEAFADLFLRFSVAASLAAIDAHWLEEGEKFRPSPKKVERLLWEYRNAPPKSEDQAAWEERYYSAGRVEQIRMTVANCEAGVRLGHWDNDIDRSKNETLLVSSIAALRRIDAAKEADK